ncbi:MAG: hypothetical protein KGR26_01150 [Cyanobacteria bacterium REEB65]|nr:hypothetical protein [Cyanobacteria bacterium REEB65]
MNFEAAIAAGLWGTVGLTLFMGAMRLLGYARIRFGRLLGELVFRPGPIASGFGLAAHFLAGMGFALIYAALWDWMGFHPTWESGLWMGAIFGIYHFFVQFPLVGLARVLHPKVRQGVEPDPGVWAFRYGPGEALSQFLGHEVFGLVVGASIALSAGWLILVSGIGAAIVVVLGGAVLTHPAVDVPLFAAFLREQERHPETPSGK